MRLTEHFTLDELTRSDYAVRAGIDNTPPEDLQANLQMLAEGLERVRDMLGTPIIISSGYRSEALNSAIHGARNSAHMEARAADFISPKHGRPSEIVTTMMAHRQYLNADQVILEYDRWVHVSFAKVARNEFLSFNGKSYIRLA